MNRQMLIERIYDAVEFPHSATSVYCDLYYGLAKAQQMERTDFKSFFPQFIDPCTQNYRLKESNALELTTAILENSRLDILECIADELERTLYLEYDDGYDSY